MKPVKLSTRLQTIADMIQTDSMIADIGTDHALLPVYLMTSGRISKAYACDIAKGPLNRAKSLIEAYDLQANIQTILCDGISKVPQDVDTLIIAGMGYDTITMILEADYHRLKQFQHILIQSNSKIEQLRTWICDHHFAIQQEALIEDGHFYTVIDINPNQHYDFSEDEILFGIHLDKQPAFIPYWKMRLEVLQQILKDMPHHQASYSLYLDMYHKIQKRIGL